MGQRHPSFLRNTDCQWDKSFLNLNYYFSFYPTAQYLTILYHRYTKQTRIHCHLYAIENLPQKKVHTREVHKPSVTLLFLKIIATQFIKRLQIEISKREYSMISWTLSGRHCDHLRYNSRWSLVSVYEKLTRVNKNKIPTFLSYRVWF